MTNKKKEKRKGIGTGKEKDEETERKRKEKGKGKNSSEPGRGICRKKELDAVAENENIISVHSENFLHYFILSRNVTHHVYFERSIVTNI